MESYSNVGKKEDFLINQSKAPFNLFLITASALVLPMIFLLFIISRTLGGKD